MCRELLSIVAYIAIMIVIAGSASAHAVGVIPDLIVRPTAIEPEV